MERYFILRSLLIIKYSRNPEFLQNMISPCIVLLLARFSLLWKSTFCGFCHKLRFYNSYNLATRFSRPLIFQTINSGRSNSLSLKYQRFTPSGCKDIGIRKCKFVAKTQFLYCFLHCWTHLCSSYIIYLDSNSSQTI